MGVVQFFVDNPNQFIWQVFAPIGIWLLVVLGFFILLLRRYTFGNWTKDNPNPFAGETFEMPRGVFRGILTLSLLFIVVVLELVTVRIIGFEDQIHELMVAFQMMIAFYFGSKVLHHMTSTDRIKTEVMAETNPNYNNNNNNNVMQNVQQSQTGGEFDDESAAG